MKFKIFNLKFRALPELALTSASYLAFCVKSTLREEHVILLFIQRTYWAFAGWRFKGKNKQFMFMQLCVQGAQEGAETMQTHDLLNFHSFILNNPFISSNLTIHFHKWKLYYKVLLNILKKKKICPFHVSL